MTPVTTWERGQTGSGEMSVRAARTDSVQGTAAGIISEARIDPEGFHCSITTDRGDAWRLRRRGDNAAAA